MEKRKTGSIIMIVLIVAAALGFWYFTTRGSKGDMNTRGTFVYLMDDGTQVVDYL